MQSPARSRPPALCLVAWAGPGSLDAADTLAVGLSAVSSRAGLSPVVGKGGRHAATRRALLRGPAGVCCSFLCGAPGALRVARQVPEAEWWCRSPPPASFPLLGLLLPQGGVELGEQCLALEAFPRTRGGRGGKGGTPGPRPSPPHPWCVGRGGGCEARGGRVPRRPARVPRGADSARRWRRVSVRLLRWAEPGTRGSRGRLGPGLPASLAPFVSSLACCIGREGPVALLQCHARTGRQKGEPEGPTAPGSRPPAVTAHVAGLCLIFYTVNILKECFFLPLPQTPPPSPHLHSEPS